MLKTALTAILIAGFAANALAVEGPKYDRKIEAAVKRIVARKVGDIRGPFNADANAIAAGDAAATDNPAEQPIVQVALLDVESQPAFPSSSNYHSGRPEPIRKVRKVSSFQYF
jgi:hypothetical protein